MKVLRSPFFIAVVVVASWAIGGVLYGDDVVAIGREARGNMLLLACFILSDRWNRWVLR